MTRDQFKAFALTLDQMTDEDLAKYSIVETSALEAHVHQANAADAKVEVLANRHKEELAKHIADHAETSRLLEVLGGRQHAQDVMSARALRQAKDAKAAALKQLEEQEAILKSANVDYGDGVTEYKAE